MRFHRFWIAGVLLTILGTAPLAALPFGRSWAGDADLPRPVGIGIDIFSMDQAYQISSLQFTAPGFNQTIEGLEVDNNITEINVKLDAWLLPFMNVFVIAGDLEGTTAVDLRGAGPALQALPFETIHLDYGGMVYGAGMTLAAGGRRMFGAVTITLSKTDLGGDFESDVEALVIMPKIGIQGHQGSFWVGGLFLDTDENHRGTMAVPPLGDVEFEIHLTEKDSFNYLLGASLNLSEHWTLTMEGGFGKRTTTLINLDYRF